MSTNSPRFAAPAQPMAGLARRPLLGRALLLASTLAFGAAGLVAPAAAEPTVQTNRRVGTGVYELAITGTPRQLFVATAGERGKDNAQLLILDPATLEQRGVMELGANGAFGLAANERNELLYATSTRVGSLLVISPRENRVVATIRAAAEGAPHLRQVVMDAAHDRAYVSVFEREGDSAVWVIDTAANKLDRVISTGLGAGVTGLALDAANNRLFATALPGNEVLEIDLAKNAVTRRFPSGGEGAVNVAYDAARGRLLVANQKSGEVAVINAADGKLIRTIATGAGALSITLDAPRNRVYVANRGAGTVTVLDADSLAVLANLATGTHPNTVVVDASSGVAYVSNKAKPTPRGEAPVEDPRGDTVSVIRP